METQMVDPNAKTIDIVDIVEKRNSYQIGEWSLLYNGTKNPVTFGFDTAESGGVRIAVSGSAGWVRLVRQIPNVEKSGIYTVALDVGSLVENPQSTFEPHVFRTSESGVFKKHCRLKLRDGKYQAKLHIPKEGIGFWIGFETVDQDIELFVNQTRLTVRENAIDLVKGLAESRGVELPLVAKEQNSRNYATIAEYNREYATRVKSNELPFLLDYAAAIRRIEMPETFLRLIRYLVVKYDQMERGLQKLLLTQVRNALTISHDEELVKLISAHCPEILPALDMSDNVLAKIVGLRQITLGDGASILDRHVYYAHQDNAEELYGLVHKKLVKDPDYLREHPSAYCALANAYASRSGGELLYQAYTNLYLESYNLPKLESVRFSDGCGLGGLSFGPVPYEIERGPLVSVIMSAFDSEETVGYAIDSLLSQTYRNIEVLVCDDRSSDNTLRIVRQYAEKDSRVRVFQSARNQGTYNIRNDLIREAKGEYLTFQDADDLALPCRLESQLSSLVEERKSVCFTHWLRVHPTGRFVYFHDGHVSRFCVVSAMAHRSVFERLPPFRPALVAADTEFYELCKCLLGEDNIFVLRRPLIFGLWGDGSLTKRSNLQADHSGFVAIKRRRYAEIAARQRAMGESIVPDEEVEKELQALGIYRKPCGLSSEVIDITCVATDAESAPCVQPHPKATQAAMA